MQNIRKIRNTGQVLVAIGIYVSVAIMLGIFNFFILSANGAELTFYSFWLPTLFGALMYLLVYIATATLRYSNQEFRDQEFVDIEESIIKHRPALIGNLFRTYINGIDFQNKRVTWEQKINTKLANHQLWLTHRMNTKIARNNYGWIVRAYLRKEERLKKYLTDDWINKFLKYKWLFYPRLTVSEVINGRMRATTRHSMLNRNHLASQISQKIFFVFLSLIGSALVATITITPNPDWFNIMFQLASMVFFIAVNTTTGFLAGTLAHKSRLNTSIERLEIISNYLK